MKDCLQNAIGVFTYSQWDNIRQSIQNGKRTGYEMTADMLIQNDTVTISGRI